MMEMIKKIFKRTFVILFCLFVVLCYIISLIDLEKSIAYNIGKFVFFVFFVGGFILAIKWIEEWKEGK